MSAEAVAYRAAWVLPVSAPAISDGAVRVDGAGRIAAVGPAAAVARDDVRTEDLGEAVLMPGMVNLHAHPELTLLRGALEDERFDAWIDRLIELKYETLTPEQLRLSTWLGAAEAIAAGITCLAAPDDAGFLLGALHESGLRGRVYREVFGPDPQEADAALDGLRERIEAMRAASSDRVQPGVSPHAPYTVSARLFRRLTEYALAEELPLTVHVAESRAEDRFVADGAGPFAERLRVRGIAVEAHGRSPVAWLDELGVLQARPLLVHCVHVDAADIGRIADSGSSAAHCPISNARFGHGVAPLPDLLARGVPVGLGSDSVASNNRVDLLEEARFASLLQRSLRGQPDLLPAAELLALVTLAGARALGLEQEVGSLEPGKAADLTAVRLDGPATTPAGDPTAALFHAARATDVCLTVVEGRVLYRDGRHLSVDWTDLRDRAAGVRPAD